MATKTKKTPIQRDVTKGSQSWNLTAIHRLPIPGGELKLRVEVKLDSYANQSFARCKVWSGATMSWNLVADIPFGALEDAGAGHARNQPTGLVRAEDRLLKLAAEVLK